VQKQELELQQQIEALIFAFQEHEEEQSLTRLNGTERAASGNEQAGDDTGL